MGPGPADDHFPEPYDALNQKWAGGPGSMMTSNSPLADVFLDNIKLGHGSISLKIVDNERKLNINLADQPLLDAAMRLIGVDAGDAGPITASILDWIDPDTSEHLGAPRAIIMNPSIHRMRPRTGRLTI